MLADYDPLSERELGLRQMDQVKTELINTDYNTDIMIIQVDLLKTGCAGWWFVQLVRPPYSQVRVRKFSHPRIIFVKLWSKSESKPLSQQTPKSNKSPKKRKKRRIWTFG